MYSTSSTVPSFLTRQLSLSARATERATYGRRAEIARLNEHLATGKSVNRASDDPASFNVARAMDQTLSRYDQYLRTITDSRLWVDETEAALSRIGEHLSSAYEGAVRAGNAALSDDDRNAIADEIEGLLAEIVDELNAKAGSEYLFAGDITDGPPFAQDSSGTADAAGVTYYGDDGDRIRTMGDDLDVRINLSGQDVFVQSSGTTLTESLTILVDAIRSGDPDAIENGLSEATAARDHVLALVGSAGATSRRMGIAEDQLRQSSIRIEARRSAAEDTDLTQTITDLQRHQLGLQAATQAMLALRQLDITNFLQ